MTERSRSLLFLMEQVIVITIFAICAAVCIRIFVDSYMTANDNRDLNNAMLVAASGAEACKASRATSQVAAFLGEPVSHSADTVTVYYDGRWQPCEEDDARYMMNVAFRRPAEASGENIPLPALMYGDISVEKTSGEEIIAFTTAARWPGDE